MQTRTKVFISIAALAVAYASGHYFSPEKIKTEVRTVEVEKIVTKVVHQTITIHEKPDGTKDTTIVTDANTNSTTNKESKDATKEVTVSKDRFNISVLAGSTFPLNLSSPIYGISVNRNILGPLTAGIFGMTNSTVGISLGLNL